MKTIQWNHVTWYSKLLAVIVGLLILAMGIYIGATYQFIHDEEIYLAGLAK